MAKRMVQALYRRVPVTVERGDLLAAAMVGVWETVLRHGHRDERVLHAVAAQRILGALRDELRRESFQPSRRRKNPPRIAYLEDIVTPIVALQQPTPRYDLLLDVERVLLRASERDRKLIRLIYVDCLSQKEAAYRMGLTEPQMSECHKMAMEKLRKGLARR